LGQVGTPPYSALNDMWMSVRRVLRKFEKCIASPVRCREIVKFLMITPADATMDGLWRYQGFYKLNESKSYSIGLIDDHSARKNSIKVIQVNFKLKNHFL
jgi:hypothetical protein